MKDKMYLVWTGISLLCAAIIAGAVLIWAPVCTGTLEMANGNMMPMRCTYTAKIALLLAAILAIVSIAGMITKNPMTAAVIAISCAFILLTFDTPLSIGVCRAEMACWDTAFWLRLFGGISAIAALTGFVMSGTRKRVKE